MAKEMGYATSFSFIIFALEIKQRLSSSIGYCKLIIVFVVVVNVTYL